MGKSDELNLAKKYFHALILTLLILLDIDQIFQKRYPMSL